MPQRKQCKESLRIKLGPYIERLDHWINLEVDFPDHIDGKSFLSCHSDLYKKEYCFYSTLKKIKKIFDQAHYDLCNEFPDKFHSWFDDQEFSNGRDPSYESVARLILPVLSSDKFYTRAQDYDYEVLAQSYQSGGLSFKGEQLKRSAQRLLCLARNGREEGDEVDKHEPKDSPSGLAMTKHGSFATIALKSKKRGTRADFQRQVRERRGEQCVWI